MDQAKNLHVLWLAMLPLGLCEGHRSGATQKPRHGHSRAVAVMVCWLSFFTAFLAQNLIFESADLGLLSQFLKVFLE